MGEYPVTLMILATMLEAKPFISGLKLSQRGEKPYPVFTNERQVLVISGIGKAHAAAATAYGCLTFDPAVVINAGAAGALDTAHPVGEIYQISRIVEHDRPDILTGQPVAHLPALRPGIQSTVLVTGDRPVIDPADRARLSGLAGLVDMEAAAVVQTCRTLNIPCYVVKLVSDDPGHTTGIDIINNIREFRTALYEFCRCSVLPDR